MELMLCSENEQTRSILKSISQKVADFALQEIMIYPTKYSGIIHILFKKSPSV